MPERLDPFASTTRMRALVEQLPVTVYVDSDERFPRCLYVSPNIESILGYPPERVIAEPELWRRAIHPDDRTRVYEHYDECWLQGAPFRVEYRMVRPDGAQMWVRDSSVLVLRDDGVRLAWQGVLEDITTERLTAQEVEGSEARYRALVERIPAVVYEMGPDDERRTLYVSSHVEEVLGYTRAEWLDQPDIWIELLHADDREVVLDRHDRHSRTGEPWDLEYRMIANDGRVVWVHDRGTLIRGAGRPPAWHGVMIDVTAERDAREMLLLTNEELERRVAERTRELEEANELMSLEIGERRRIESELVKAQRRYQRLVEDLPGVAYLWEATPGATDRSFSYVSPQIETMLGFATDDWRADERVHPHDRDHVAEEVRRSIRTGEPLRIEYRCLAADGRIVWVLEHASLIARTDDGDPHVFQGVLLDVTGVKEAETKAARAERRFRILAEEGPVVAYAFELRYEGEAWPPSVTLLYVSPQLAEVLGSPIARWASDSPANWFGSIHPDDRTSVEDLALVSWRTGSDWSIRYRMLRDDGEVIWIQDTGRMVERDDAGRPSRFQGVLFDVTDDQESKRHLERIEAEQRAALHGAGAIPWTQTVDATTGFERYSYIGPQAFEILGYTPEELIEERHHFERMLHPDDRQRVRRSMARAAETGTWDDEYRILRRDGEVRWLRSFGRRGTPPGETPEVWHGIAVDVTTSRRPEPTPTSIAVDGDERGAR